MCIIVISLNETVNSRTHTAIHACENHFPTSSNVSVYRRSRTVRSIPSFIEPQEEKKKLGCNLKARNFEKYSSIPSHL